MISNMLNTGFEIFASPNGWKMRACRFGGWTVLEVLDCSDNGEWEKWD